MKSLLWGIGIIIILVLAYVAYGMWGIPAASQGTESSSVAWEFTELPEQNGVPQTRVALSSNGETKVIGTYAGTCFEIEGSSWTLLENESAGAICWFAGGGNEIGIFREGGKTLVKVGDLDEGTAETPGVRGNFKTVLELK